MAADRPPQSVPPAPAPTVASPERPTVPPSLRVSPSPCPRVSASPRRLLARWRLFARLDLVWVTRDLIAFVSYTLSDAALNVATVTTILLLATRFHGIGPWSRDQIVFMLGYGTTVSGLASVLFGYNIMHISRRIGRGQLDHVLVQPQPLWMALATEGFNPYGGAGMLLFGLGLLLWAVAKLGLVVSLAWVGWLALNLAASLAVTVAFSVLVGSLAFWAPRAAEEICSPSVQLLETLKPFPLDALGPWLLGGLLTLLPVGFLAWLPARGLLGLDASLLSRLGTPLFALLLSLLALWVFRRGLRHYVRTGSQRYLAHGHRR
jgi:ABC-2 type transport system permease protein